MSLRLLLDRSHSGLNVRSRLQVLAIELDCIRHELVLGVVVSLHLDLEAGLQHRQAHLFPSGMKNALHVLNLRVVGEDHGNVPVIGLQRHGCAAASIDYSLKLCALRDNGCAQEQRHRE